jgi:hypothetical protein
MSTGDSIYTRRRAGGPFSSTNAALFSALGAQLDIRPIIPRLADIFSGNFA